MIFLYVGLVVFGAIALAYALYKWLIPMIIKAIKNKKARKEEEVEDNYMEVNEVELSSKGSHADIDKEQVTYSDNYREVTYFPDKEKTAKVESEVVEESNAENDEKLVWANDLETVKVDRGIRTQIKKSSPKLKAIIMSGALHDKKYKD